MALDLSKLIIDRYKIDIPGLGRRGSKSEAMFQFFRNLTVGVSFTLPKKDTSHVRKVFDKWKAMTDSQYILIGRKTSDPKTYRFWLAKDDGPTK